MSQKQVVEPHRGLPSRPPFSEGGGHEQGIALIIALFFTFIALGLVMSGSLVMEAANKRSELVFRLEGQVRQFGEAGLVETIDWFRRQPSQPVTSFTPKRDETASPPILDTDDPTLGLVREFEISKGVYGRYEVRRLVPLSSPPIPETQDVSAMRGALTNGMVWRIVCRSYVYRQKDPDTEFNVWPNQVLATDVIEPEIRRMPWTPPAPAAVCASRGDAVTVAGKGRVMGGSSTGIAYPEDTGTPSIGDVTGSPPTAAVPGFNTSVQAVFGSGRELLKAMADDRVRTDAAFPYPVPTNALVFVETDVTFDSARPLKGTGILYIDGDLVISDGSNSFFNGLIYVDGDVTINPPALISGTLIATGKVTISGSGDVSEVVYDDGVLNALMVAVGQYRLSGSIFRSDLRHSQKFIELR